MDWKDDPEGEILVLAEDTGSIPSTEVTVHSYPQLQFQGIRCPLLTAVAPSLHAAHS